MRQKMITNRKNFIISN